MKKTAVIYWSGTGNTEAMANAVLEGMTAAGAEAKLLTVDQVNTAELNGYAAIAFGCPAMGSEVLEEMEFQPMFDACKNCLGGKAVALFGSYGWGAPWARPWRNDRRYVPAPPSAAQGTDSAAAAGRPLRRSGGIQMKSTPQAKRPEGCFFTAISCA